VNATKFEGLTDNAWLRPWVDCPCGSKEHQAGGHDSSIADAINRLAESAGGHGGVPDIIQYEPCDFGGWCRLPEYHEGLHSHFGVGE
jgi:hypothetical protein